jgi:hypothetical protein
MVLVMMVRREKELWNWSRRTVVRLCQKAALVIIEIWAAAAPTRVEGAPKGVLLTAGWDPKGVETIGTIGTPW